MKNKELTATANKGYALVGQNMSDEYNYDLDGVELRFDRIRIPSGGGLAYEMPGQNPASPDMVKEFKAVIVYHHKLCSYYKSEYTGGNEPPFCGSIDGRNGIEQETGEVKSCINCQFSKWGSDKDGKGKACKQKRRVYLIIEGNLFPTVVTIPTTSMRGFDEYLQRITNKGRHSNEIVTKFSLQKAQSNDKITYSQVVVSMDRNLETDELAAIKKMTAQVMAYAKGIEVAEGSQE